MPASLDIVIVNWNTGDALRACLQSIAEGAAGVTLARVVVVDNASTDDSMTRASAVRLPLTVVGNDANRGFGAACNQGARGSAADYLLFLNPDTLLEPDTLARTLAFLESPAQADVGICGIRLLGDDGLPSTSAARFPSPRIIFGEATGLGRVVPGLFPRHLLTADDCATTRDVDQVIGAYFVIRRALFDALAGFDERFFVYFEEVDLSLRARLAGYRSVFFADASAYHAGGLSSDQVKAARLFYTLRGRLLYAWKHFPVVERWLVMAITLGVEWPARTLLARAKGGAAPAETSDAFRRLRAFVATPDWQSSRDVQRRP
ncbi:MAG: glycosyltransferase family 2 protein [Acidobacteria bacterium]|nr:glycosyltransferase family 2 protein [Acidobacteriota bacterium]